MTIDAIDNTNCFKEFGAVAIQAILKVGKIEVMSGGYIAKIEVPDDVSINDVTVVVNGYVNTVTGPVSATGTGYVVDNKGKVLGNPDSVKTRISTVAELSAFRDKINSGVVIPYAELAADIDLTGLAWAPIGNWAHPYHGEFNGNGHKIIGLTSNGAITGSVYSVGDTTGYGEVFGFIAITGGGDVNVSDVKFTDVSINLAGGINVGAVIGYAPNNGNFKDSSKSGAASGSYASNTTIGTDDITLSNITVTGNIKGNTHVAGLVGKVYSTGDVKITNCTNEADVTMTGAYGGGIVNLIAGANSVLIEKCVNKGTITGSSDGTGGIAGLIKGVTNEVQFNECENYGAIKGGNRAAGILGSCVGSITFTECKNHSTDITITHNIPNMKANSIDNNNTTIGGIFGAAYDTATVTFIRCSSSSSTIFETTQVRKELGTDITYKYDNTIHGYNTGIKNKCTIIVGNDEISQDGKAE